MRLLKCGIGVFLTSGEVDKTSHTAEKQEYCSVDRERESLRVRVGFLATTAPGPRFPISRDPEMWSSLEEEKRLTSADFFSAEALLP
ncbi:hypothetical protein L596_004681 [Steinernema carpocapsae]|uniref:Uncharacterized protein n=1 Tax=Steinernema carpocapsae TaxID=34508 RepID=A0A4U8V0Q1_STECR|nr:hypothetical protein L596_004681 [Steinernema carpocapsae]